MDSSTHEPQPPATDLALGDSSYCHGWTPFARRLFLDVLAQTGRVSTACEYTTLTRQSAYALRARDPLFAASWDAACELARQPLADALYEKALDGVTDIITKDGEVIAERHRFDSRLSIAVLHRLDKRCDRAAEAGSAHLALVRRWDEWLALIGNGRESEAAGLLAAETANDCQNCQNSEEANPTGEEQDDDDSLDLSDRCWRGDDPDEAVFREQVWLTDFPPPPGFTGYESRPYGDLEDEEPYVRACTDEEAAALDAGEASERAAERAEEEALRDSWFAMLRGESAAEAATATAAAPGE